MTYEVIRHCGFHGPFYVMKFPSDSYPSIDPAFGTWSVVAAGSFWAMDAALRLLRL